MLFLGIADSLSKCTCEGLNFYRISCVHLFYESDTFYVMKKGGEGNVVLFSRFVVAADVE